MRSGKYSPKNLIKIVQLALVSFFLAVGVFFLIQTDRESRKKELQELGKIYQEMQTLIHAGNIEKLKPYLSKNFKPDDGVRAFDAAGNSSDVGTLESTFAYFSRPLKAAGKSCLSHEWKETLFFPACHDLNIEIAGFVFYSSPIGEYVVFQKESDKWRFNGKVGHIVD